MTNIEAKNEKKLAHFSEGGTPSPPRTFLKIFDSIGVSEALGPDSAAGSAESKRAFAHYGTRCSISKPSSKNFSRPQKVLSSEDVLTRITFEAIEDASREGIRILELRFAPT